MLAIRTHLGISQVAFAEKLGLGVSTIEKWEKMYHAPYSREAEFFKRVEKAVLGTPGKYGPKDDDGWRELVGSSQDE